MSGAPPDESVAPTAEGVARSTEGVAWTADEGRTRGWTGDISAGRTVGYPYPLPTVVPSWGFRHREILCGVPRRFSVAKSRFSVRDRARYLRTGTPSRAATGDAGRSA